MNDTDKDIQSKEVENGERGGVVTQEFSDEVTAKMSPCQSEGEAPGRSSWRKSPAAGLLEHSQRSREIRGGRDGGGQGRALPPAR